MGKWHFVFACFIERDCFSYFGQQILFSKLQNPKRISIMSTNYKYVSFIQKSRFKRMSWMPEIRPKQYTSYKQSSTINSKIQNTRPSTLAKTISPTKLDVIQIFKKNATEKSSRGLLISRKIAKQTSQLVSLLNILPLLNFNVTWNNKQNLRLIAYNLTTPTAEAGKICYEKVYCGEL